MTEEQFEIHLSRIKDPDLVERLHKIKHKMENGTYRHKPIAKSEIDIKPCGNCGRVVYCGKCCDNPS